MSDVLRVVGSLFGIGPDTTQDDVKPQYVDPVAERQALAELRGSGIIEEHDEPAPRPHSDASPVQKDGDVDFDLLFAQSGVNQQDFTADQAIKLIANVEKTIPAVMSDIHEREALLRNILCATMSGSATPSNVAADAHRKIEIVNSLVRSQLDLTVDFKQRASDKIKALEKQIAELHVAVDSADQQFGITSSLCKSRQAQYARLAQILTQDDTPVVNNKAE